MPSSHHRQGFTLIELLVVIAVIAVLSVVVVLALNPAETLRQSRDANRLSDLSVFQTAMGTYTNDRAGTASSLALGTTSVIYLSLPDVTATTSAGSNCASLGLSALPAGYSYHCAGTGFYRRVDGTGWIPVNLSGISLGAPLGQLPVDPTNTSSSGKYYEYATDGTNWKMSAVPESAKYGSQIASFQSGSNVNLLGGSQTYWVAVPGNSSFGTQNFSVMKYAAVCSDGNGNYLNDYNTSYNTYSDPSKNCTSANDRVIASLPGGWPIANVSQITAASYCASIGAHLMTNNEWQTVAWNAEQVPQNWQSGVVGTGTMYSGHNDNVPATASVASGNDSQDCVGTDGPASCGGTGSNASQLRTLALSNGQVIWDMGGNVWQWTNDTITGTNEPHGASAGWKWIDFTSVTTWGSMTQQTAGPANATWNSSNGIGELYSENATDGTNFAFLRGGTWSNGSYAGVEALGLNYAPSNTNTYIGFRCAR